MFEASLLQTVIKSNKIILLKEAQFKYTLQATRPTVIHFTEGPQKAYVIIHKILYCLIALSLWKFYTDLKHKSSIRIITSNIHLKTLTTQRYN